MSHGLPTLKDIKNLPNSYTNLRRIENIDKVAKLPYIISLAEIGVRTAVIEGLMTQARLSHNHMVYDGMNNPYEIGVGIYNGQIGSAYSNYDAPLNGSMASDGFTTLSGDKSKLGTYVYTNLIFPATNGYGNNTETIDGTPRIVINDCLVKVSQTKRLVTTDIQGKDNQVIEYIGMSNYVVQVTGRLTGSYKVFPKEEMINLRKLLSLPQPLSVVSWWLNNMFSIVDLVITDFDFPQTEGEYSTQYFTFNAVSDKPTELNITNNYR
jgi:hypothetical protein